MTLNKSLWLFAFSPPPLALLPKRLALTQPSSVPFWEHALLKRLDSALLSTCNGFMYLNTLRIRSLQYKRAGESESWRLAVRDMAQALGLDKSGPIPDKLKSLGSGLMKPPARCQWARRIGVGPPPGTKRKESFFAGESS
jgi:hypothetical protein